jgi:hypothetical protein
MELERTAICQNLRDEYIRGADRSRCTLAGYGATPTVSNVPHVR